MSLSVVCVFSSCVSAFIFSYCLCSSVCCFLFKQLLGVFRRFFGGVVCGVFYFAGL